MVRASLWQARGRGFDPSLGRCVKKCESHLELTVVQTPLPKLLRMRAINRGPVCARTHIHQVRTIKILTLAEEANLRGPATDRHVPSMHKPRRRNVVAHGRVNRKRSHTQKTYAYEKNICIPSVARGERERKKRKRSPLQSFGRDRNPRSSLCSMHSIKH